MRRAGRSTADTATRQQSPSGRYIIRRFANHNEALLLNLSEKSDWSDGKKQRTARVLQV